jgi:L-amino acid N-acyltransferase YncA/glycerol uptake facilitator-like aquaporin
VSGPARPGLSRRLAAETVGSAFLLAAVVGSGIMGERLAGGNVALALLANTLATGAALVALILTFGPISGAHFNPAVTLADAWQRGLPWRETPLYIGAQIVGAFAGVAVAHVMFETPAVFFASQHARAGPAQVFSEFVATFGLLAVIWGCVRFRAPAVPFAVAAYITAAYWFTASTSFANPAVTLARSATDTFAGIRPIDAPAFIGAQLAGAAAATALFRWLVPALPNVAADVVYRPRAPDVAPTADRLTTRLATVDDAAAVAAIYNEGIADGVATFETEPRTTEQIAALLADRGGQFPTVVVERDGRVIAWAGAGPYRNRPAYSGVAEHSVYVARAARGTGAGRAVLDALCRTYSERGFWKIVSRIFSENTTSLMLHERCGFRVVGVYRRHGRRNGAWHDCVIVERLLDG